MHLSRTRLLAYGITGFPLAALGLPLYVYVPTFYAESLGVGMASVGFALLGVRLFDMVSDPMVGGLSDHWHSRFGRRKGLMLLGLPVLMLGLEQLFRPAGDPGAGYLFGWGLITYLGWTLVTVPYAAWGAEISPDYHERSRIAASREGFLIAGTLAAIGIPASVGIAGDPAASLDLVARVLLIVLPAAALITLFSVADGSSRQQPIAWREGLPLLWRNRAMLRLALAYVLNGAANGLPATLFLFFVSHVLEARAWSGVLLGIYFLAGIAGLPLWLGVARRIGKHRAWGISMGFACLVFMWVPFLGSGDVVWFSLICVLSGLSLGADLALPTSIQADVVDVDRALGGGQRTGLYFGLWGMATKLSLALAVGIAFPLLELSGFEADADNAAPALLVLALLYGAAPVAIKLISIGLIWRFPLDEAAHGELRAPNVDSHARKPPYAAENRDPRDDPAYYRSVHERET